MMKFILYIFFMIPICYNFYLVQLSLMFCILMLILFHSNNFFSMISYIFGLDYFSFGLVLLSILIISFMFMSMNYISNDLNKFLFSLNLIFLMIILLMIFSSLNLIFMYVFFELSLIPLMILIFGWGYQPERLISSLYLFFYTLFASLPLLILLIYIYMSYKLIFFDSVININTSFIIHFCMIFAFLVKLPMFMVHFWLPKAHVQAPVAGSMILAGVLLKIGGYGIIRFLFMFDTMFLSYGYVWFSLALVGSFLVSICCLIQSDMKCLIAYSSVSHMSMCLLGLMTFSYYGIMGSYLMMISHGLCSSGLFFLSYVIYSRSHSRSFFLNKGMLTFMPSLSFFWFMFCAFNMSCPPSLNFLSEVMIIFSMMMYWSNSFFYFFIYSFLSASFSFYLYSFINHGFFSQMYSSSLCLSREYLLLFIHLIPLFFILPLINSFLI